MRRAFFFATGAWVMALGACHSPGKLEAPTAAHAMSSPGMPGACEAPASANVGKAGCYFDVAVDVGALSSPAFFHVDEFSDAATAEAARGPGGAVVHAYGRIFLETVNTDARWRPAGGRRLAMVGPMEAPRGTPVTARFMQAMTLPGAVTRPHLHAGPEAFFLLSGAICMETPAGGETTHAGDTYWVPGGVPMQLTSAGAGLRRSLFVVLHPSSQPWMTMTRDWTPSGACAQRK